MSKLLSSDQIIKTILKFGFQLVSFLSIVRQSGLSVDDFFEKKRKR